jgi:hypothetical protein
MIGNYCVPSPALAGEGQDGGIPFVWGIAGLLIVPGALRFSLPTKLPTQQFLKAGAGQVLDAGAGSGSIDGDSVTGATGSAHHCIGYICGRLRNRR